MARARWLEHDDDFEGVGAHPLNPRYDPVDEDDPEPPPAQIPQTLLRAQTLVGQPVHPMHEAVIRAGTPPYQLDGHDGSHHQFDAGPVDLHALADATWIIWWKATQSIHYVDPTFAQVWARRQMWSHRAPYHWLSSTTDPEQQASHFLNTVPDGIAVGDGGMADVEELGDDEPRTLAFLEAVERERRRSMSVYTGLYVAGGTIWRSEKIREGKYGPRPMHLAAYVTEENLAARMRSLGMLPNYDKDAWQFWSGGPVPGITGRADMNRIERRAVYDLAYGITDEPAPVPTPGDEMPRNYYVVTGSHARFIGYPDEVQWTGPGDPKLEAGIQLQLDKGNLVQEEVTGGPMAFAAARLIGDLPTGDPLHEWTGDEFANTLQIRQRNQQQPPGPAAPFPSTLNITGGSLSVEAP